MKRHLDAATEDIKSEFRLIAEQLSARNEKFIEHDQKIENLNNDVLSLETKMSVVEEKVKR